MLRSLCRLPIAVVVGVLAALSSCEKKPQLTEIEVPDAGVSLRYDLAPGQSYDGHIRMRNAVATPLGEVIQSVEFDVDLSVTGAAAGKTELLAKIADLRVDVRLPEGMPTDGARIGQDVLSAAEDTELRFSMLDTGEVDDMSEPPEGAKPELQLTISLLGRALTGAFVTLPDKALKQGDTWDATRRDGKGMPGKGTFGGMAREESAGEDVAKLDYSFSGELGGEDGGPKLEGGTATIAALFSTNGYPLRVDRTVTGEVKGLGTLNLEIEAQWTKRGQGSAPSPTSAPAGETQAISDPCDPDYVGAEECVEDAPPAAEPEPDAAPPG